MTTSTTPNPLSVFGARKADVAQQVATAINLGEPGTSVRPVAAHDGVVKAKHLRPGQKVRPYVRDRKTGQQAPRGAERTVGSVERTQDGAFVLITWSSAHSPEERPAAYRFHNAALVTEAGFTAYQEV